MPDRCDRVVPRYTWKTVFLSLPFQEMDYYVEEFSRSGMHGPRESNPQSKLFQDFTDAHSELVSHHKGKL